MEAEGLQKARDLRGRMTPQEVRLWERLRDRQFQDSKFRRQQPLGPYIVDFCAFESKLIVEIDGSHHTEENQKVIDQERDAYFIDQGYQVVRFWNDEIDNNLDLVLSRISESLSTRGRGINEQKATAKG